ncbi:MAG TPA: hypothetical protein VNK67_10085 [Burkholderiales bacterium]|nr:hypothetical protein [Burkholderiales bacterium]
MEAMEIFCPRCQWRPGHEARWVCRPGCGTVWNTFWTRGLCPGCAKQWEVTQCLACHRISPHKQWYHLPQPGRARPRGKRVPAAA